MRMKATIPCGVGVFLWTAGRWKSNAMTDGTTIWHIQVWLLTIFLALLFIPKVQQQGLFGEACDRPCVVRRFYKKSGAGTRLPPLQKYCQLWKSQRKEIVLVLILGPFYPDWGSKESRLTRKAPPSYGDGVYTMAGNKRPNARKLSQTFMRGTNGLGSRKNRQILMFFAMGRLAAKLSFSFMNTFVASDQL